MSPAHSSRLEYHWDVLLFLVNDIVLKEEEIKENYDLDVCTNFKQSLRRVQVNLLHVLLRPVLCHNLHMPEFLSRLAESKNKI